MLLHVQQLAQQRFVLLLDILELLLLDQPVVFEFQKPLLLLHQVGHLFLLVLQLGLLLPRNLFLLELSPLLLTFDLGAQAGVQSSQFFLVLRNGLRLLVNLTLQHPGYFEHVFFVRGDVLRCPGHVPFEVLQSDRALLVKVVQLGQLVGLLLLLDLDVLVGHFNL